MQKSKVKPIRPQDVIDKKQDIMPDEVISAFNSKIAEHFIGRSSRVKQEDVIVEIISNLKKSDLDIVKEILDDETQDDETGLKSMIFKRHWLDVEDIFREAGWIVEYDKPGYNESYAANFTFKKETK